MRDRKRVDLDGGGVGETEKEVWEAIITIHCFFLKKKAISIAEKM